MKLPLATALALHRSAVALFMLIHGITRIEHGTVGGFGEFLNGNGFPLGTYLAWAITIFEIVGSITLIVGYFTPWISLVFVLELTTGIILVHWQNGWFVVGGGTGGMEYSVLLIVSFAFIGAMGLRGRSGT